MAANCLQAGIFAYNPRDENNDKGDTQKMLDFKSSSVKRVEQDEILARVNND